MSSNHYTITSRGFSSEFSGKLTAMIDGRKIYTPVFPSVYWDSQDLILSDIKNIEVIRGTGTEISNKDSINRNLWSNNSLNGVVNIVTKRSRETQGWYFNALKGDRESMHSVRYGGIINDNLSYKIYGKQRIYSSGLRINGEKADDSWNDKRIGFRIDWENIKERFVIQGDLSNGDFQNKSTYPSLITNQNESSIMNDASKAHNIMVKYFKKRNNGDELTVRSYYDYYGRYYTLFQSELKILDTDIQYATPTQKYGDLLFGISHRIEDANIGYQMPQYNYKHNKITSNILNSFIQNKLDIIPNKLSLTTTLKTQYNKDLKRHEFSYFTLDPSIRTNLKLNDNQSLWGAVSRSSRTPTPTEIYGTTLKKVFPTGHKVTLNGDINFQPEETISYEIGYRNNHFKNLLLESSIFANHYQNLRSYETESQTLSETRLIGDNLLYGESYGFEISSKMSLTDKLNISANYSFLKLYLHKDPSSTFATGEDEEYASPQNQFSIRSYYQISSNFKWNNLLFYVSKLKKHNIDSYIRFDSNINYNINKNIKLTVAGQNIFGKKRKEFIPFLYQEGTYSDQQFYGRINVQF
jgi:iron complex outermembrane receptor protein